MALDDFNPEEFDGLQEPNYDSFDGFDGFDGFDAEGLDASKVGSGNSLVDKQGKYHFLVTATAKPSPYGTDRNGQVDMSKSRKPSISLACRVVASSPGLSPVGSIHYHELVVGGSGPGASIDNRDRENTLNFLVGVGICKKQGDKIIDPETGTTRLKVATLTQRLNGLQFVGHVKHRPAQPMLDRDTKEPLFDDRGQPKFWDEKYEFSWGRGCWTVDADEVSDVPKSLEHLKLIGKEHLIAPKSGGAKPATHANGSAAGAGKGGKLTDLD